MEALECAEQLLGAPEIDAGTVVTDKASVGVRVANPADLDRRAISFGRELPGVAEEVIERDGQQPLVTMHRDRVRDVDGHRAVRLRRAQPIDDLSGELREIDGATVQLL